MTVPAGAKRAQSRWEEWVIVASIVLLFAIGVGAIWGQSLQELVGPADSESPGVSPGGERSTVGPGKERL